MRFNALLRETAKIGQYILGNLRWERERELIIRLAAAQIRDVQGMLPKKDAHPLLSHRYVGTLKLILQAEWRFIDTQF
jgi:hypothetical protein